MPATAPAATAAPPARSDLEQLQGVWTTIAGPAEARLLVAGSRFAFEFVGGEIYMGTFTLDAGSEPRRMDMRIEEGPGDHHGQVSLCIYQVDGDVLRWCPTRPGSGRRLAAFPSVDDHRYVSLVFRHARRRPRK